MHVFDFQIRIIFEQFSQAGYKDIQALSVEIVVTPPKTFKDVRMGAQTVLMSDQV